jgi:hypothetical protein
MLYCKKAIATDGIVMPLQAQGLPTHKTRPTPLRHGTSYMLGLTGGFGYKTSNFELYAL